MPRFYFHFEDGRVLLDDTGIELGDLAAAQSEALRTSGDLLRGAPRAATLRRGDLWRLWVTDKPNGEGTTLFTLRLTAES